MLHRIKVISSSVRPGRIGPHVTRWVMSHAPAADDLAFEMVDLADRPLPMDTEAGVPAWHDYTDPRTVAWGKEIEAADGFVIVTPEYNSGYPASLKNALDHLYKEWNGKPALIVSYGYRGGESSAAQLRQVLDRMKMRAVATMPALTLPDAMKEGAGPEVALAAFEPSVPALTKGFFELAAALREPS